VSRPPVDRVIAPFSATTMSNRFTCGNTRSRSAKMRPETSISLRPVESDASERFNCDIIYAPIERESGRHSRSKCQIPQRYL